MEEKERNKAYDKLTPQRKQIVDEVIKNLESGVGLWQPGWSMPGVPESAITGKKYRGVNNFLLSFVSLQRQYSESVRRWAYDNRNSRPRSYRRLSCKVL